MLRLVAKDLDTTAADFSTVLGLAVLDVEVVDRLRLLAAAQERDCTIDGDTVTADGTRFHLV
jgi:hypothetical protein